MAASTLGTETSTISAPSRVSRSSDWRQSRATSPPRREAIDLAQDADLEARDPLLDAGQVVADRLVGRGRVAGIGARDHLQSEGGVADVPASGPIWSSDEAKATSP